MHLDCVFSTIGPDCCIMLEDIMGEASPTRRLVDEYVRDPATGKYALGRCAAHCSWLVRGFRHRVFMVWARVLAAHRGGWWTSYAGTPHEITPSAGALVVATTAPRLAE